ncbi:NAD(P)-dependent alcohol dehydrogenase [Cellulosilyticum sp. I15G10I2]|uniref:NAD(P)-dependent alcohol dehydrogenase n=1 Tax=Cellulosilyticum sp. I15G10I2 TaxID=1892843 RepID=UPI00085BBCA4|nr:NAD(P)-dependent alcohol dehydrogenase [Cellulosilyticum sp. I15G10I2]
MNRMRAAVMEKIGEIKLQEREMPVPDENEVLVKIEYVGVCGSDMHYYQHGRIGNFVVKDPIVLGHECAGRIVGVGKNVKNLHQGDLVALEPGVPCGKCTFCMTGRYHLCSDVRFMATPPYDGAFVEYVTHPENLTFKLPEGMGTMEGALIEPLAVGFHAVSQSGGTVGQTAVVLGAGCIGLVTMLTLKSIGISSVYIVDIIPKRLEKARELGAACVIDGKEDVLEEIMKLTNGEGVDLVFETAGSDITTKLTPHLVKRGGTITLVGMCENPEISYDFGSILDKEVTIKSVFRYKNIYPSAINAVASGAIPIGKIVSDIYDFNEIAKAVEYNVAHKADITKMVIKM